MAKKDKGFAAEFKKFIMRGNVIDLAVGVIIGGAFQAIVNSLVNDISEDKYLNAFLYSSGEEKNISFRRFA